MTEIKRNDKTGIVEVWKDGKKIGRIYSTGDGTDRQEIKKPDKK